MDTLTKLCNAITDALREVERCPDDSIQDIFNEQLKSWRTGYHMDHRFNLEKYNEGEENERKTKI